MQRQTADDNRSNETRDVEGQGRLKEGMIMKQQIILAVAILISAGLGTAWGHGTSDAPETLTGLSNDSILHRLKQLGYSDVQVVRTNRESVDVMLQREGKKYKATLSRSLIGPGSIAVVNMAEVVEQMLRTGDISMPDDLRPRIEHRDTGSSSETIR
jgi:hypothetical protein